MKLLIALLACLGFTIWSCHSSHQEPTISDTASKAASTEVDTAANGNEQYGFIVKTDQKTDSIFIVVDHIQYLTGQAAIDAAAKAHEADTMQTADGKKHVAVANDYFIVNENDQLQSLPVDKNCVISLVINPDAPIPITDHSLESLKKASKDALFKLTVNAHGAVIRIEQIFVP
ncbi:MAG TPA: hypothetical protein VLC98_00405 [Phnomibacter sp.]|nr:hypothetical protein [Phnomibacter sp.]